MNKTESIKLFYHTGFYPPKDKPWLTLENLVKYRKLYTPTYNVGDQISRLIVEGVSGQFVEYADPWNKSKLLAVGSILGAARDNDRVWGSGLKFASNVEFVKKAKNLQIFSVRGPETQQVLCSHGIECPAVFGDPALLMSLIYPLEKQKKFKFGIIPHVKQINDFETIYNQIPEDKLIAIKPNISWQEYMKSLVNCEMILSSSLHGIIFADSYGIPALLVRHNGWLKGDSFKFLDYYHSTNREPIYIDSDELHNLDKVYKKIEQVSNPSIDLKSLIKSFPYPINNEKILEYLESLDQ